MNLVKKGSTDVTRYVLLGDSAAGTPETGYTIANLDLQYTRNRTAPSAKVDATALAATDTAHTDNRAIEIDATSSPGLYRVDWPDAAFATGADKVILVVSGTGLHPAVEEIQLVDFDPADGVRLGLTALPNAAPNAAGGLLITAAGSLDVDARLDAAVSSRMATYTQPTGFLTTTFPAGTVANTTNITAGTITTTTNLTNLPAITANWLTAAGIAAGALDGKGNWNIGKTGYSISGTTTTLDALQTALDSAHGAGSWATATGFSTLDAAGVRTAIGMASANLDTQLADLPTVAEFEARTIVSANYATASALATADQVADDIKALLRADKSIDTTVTPWDFVLTTEGSGPPASMGGAGVELLRQDIKSTAGVNLTSTDTIPGQLLG